jgi:hypothetical protein
LQDWHSWEELQSRHQGWQATQLLLLNKKKDWGHLCSNWRHSKLELYMNYPQSIHIYRFGSVFTQLKQFGSTHYSHYLEKWLLEYLNSHYSTI